VSFGYEGFRSLRVCLGFFLCVGLAVPMYLGALYVFFFFKKKKTLITYQK
jgi:hypothetical protein